MWVFGLGFDHILEQPLPHPWERQFFVTLVANMPNSEIDWCTILNASCNGYLLVAKYVNFIALNSEQIIRNWKPSIKVEHWFVHTWSWSIGKCMLIELQDALCLHKNLWQITTQKKGWIIQCYEILLEPNLLICLHVLPPTFQCTMHHIICALRIFVAFTSFCEHPCTSRVFTHFKDLHNFVAIVLNDLFQCIWNGFSQRSQHCCQIWFYTRK